MLTLIERGWEVHALTPPGQYAEYLGGMEVRWHPMKLDRRSLNPIREGFSLLFCLRAYQALRPDLVYHFTIKPILYGSLTSRWLKLPAVVNFVTGSGYLFRGTNPRIRAARLAVQPLLRIALAGTRQRTAFQHEADLRTFLDRRLVKKDNTVIIPGSGVDITRFRPNVEARGKPEVVMATRLLWSKGVGEFAELARLLRAEGRAVRATLVGFVDDGNPDAVSTRRVEQWQSEGLIEWLGRQDDMEAILGRCAVVVHPTRYGEGVPRVLLEAAACGKPIVATDVPGCREVVVDGRNGYLVPPGDIRQLYELVLKLLEDPALRHRMGEEGRKLVLEKFADGPINQRILALSDELLRSL